MSDLASNNAGPKAGFTDAAAAVFPGLVRTTKRSGPIRIKHAFRVAVRRSNGYVWPARMRPATPRVRRRWNPPAAQTPDISRYPPEIRKIFQAMKTYGLIVADNGGNLYVTGTMDQRRNSRVLIIHFPTCARPTSK